jgi:hypothetical protein
MIGQLQIYQHRPDRAAKELGSEDHLKMPIPGGHRECRFGSQDGTGAVGIFPLSCGKHRWLLHGTTNTSLWKFELYRIAQRREERLRTWFPMLYMIHVPTNKCAVVDGGGRLVWTIVPTSIATMGFDGDILKLKVICWSKVKTAVVSRVAREGRIPWHRSGVLKMGLIFVQRSVAG